MTKKLTKNFTYDYIIHIPKNLLPGFLQLGQLCPPRSLSNSSHRQIRIRRRHILLRIQILTIFLFKRVRVTFLERQCHHISSKSEYVERLFRCNVGSVQTLSIDGKYLITDHNAAVKLGRRTGRDVFDEYT